MIGTSRTLIVRRCEVWTQCSWPRTFHNTPYEPKSIHPRMNCIVVALDRVPHLSKYYLWEYIYNRMGKTLHMISWRVVGVEWRSRILHQKLKNLKNWNYLLIPSSISEGSSPYCHHHCRYLCFNLQNEWLGWYQKSP